MKKNMFLLIILCFFVSNISFAMSGTNIYKEPKYRGVMKSRFGWMKTCKKYALGALSQGGAASIFDNSELERYIKLKLRGLLNGVTVINTIPPGASLALVNMGLYRYNKKLGIYFGHIYLRIFSCSNVPNKHEPYGLVISIAGSKDDIVRNIKNRIDNIIEQYAEDYYYMQDLE
jgi:hypothetical protein